MKTNFNKPIYCLIGILFLFLSTATAQSDLGVYGSGSYYLGDINQTIPFYNTKLGGGLVYRYNLNNRNVIKINAGYLRLAASDKDFSDSYQQLRNATFSNSLLDFGAQFEINFLPFNFVDRQTDFTPYISAGIGGAIPLSGNSGYGGGLTLPFGGGFKWSIGRTWSLGLEWMTMKTFGDGLDGVYNRGGKSGLFLNNDWYSYASIWIAYRISGKPDCPQVEMMKRFKQ